MILEILIILIVLVVVFTFIRIEHVGRKFKIFLLLVIIFLIIFSVSTIISKSKANLHSPSGIIKATTSYFNWMGKAIANLWDAGRDIKDKVVESVSTNQTINRNI